MKHNKNGQVSTFFLYFFPGNRHGSDHRMV